MRSSIVVTALLSLLTCVSHAALNTSREFRLRTEPRGSQPKKTAFANLYLESYHTGAGLSDAVLGPSKAGGIKAFLNHTKLEFDFGETFFWGLVPVPNQVFYSSWQPVRVDAGAAVAGFKVNKTGLWWEDSSFSGWFVCEWWHYGTKQLFFKLDGYQTGSFNPCSCADVYLMPEYV